MALAKEEQISKELLENILESLEGGVLAIDKDCRITAFNQSAEEITGFTKEEALNEECCNVLKSELCEDACPLKQTMETGKPVYNYEIQITNKAGEQVPV